MLDGRGGGGEMGDRGGRGTEFGTAGPMERVGQKTSGRPSMRDEIDDDIPF